MERSYKLHDYQKVARDFLVQRWTSGHVGSGLFLDPGLGKTLITLDAVDLMLTFEWSKVLVVAPMRVIYNVWPNEIAKWGFPYRCSIVHGTRQQRQLALAKDAEFYAINPEGIAWLLTTGQKLPDFNCLILDESTKFKNWSAKRTKYLRAFAPKIPHSLILTGTPTPNSLAELFPQIYFVDHGEAFGNKVTHFRNKYCVRGGYENRQFKVAECYEQEIRDKIAPLCLSMDAESNLDMPDLVHNEIKIQLPGPIREAYDAIERKLFAALDSGEELIASSAAAKYNLCRQIANGGAYVTDEETGKREAVHVHDSKVDALADLYEELMGKQLLVAYQYNHDLERLRSKWPKLEAVNGRTKPKQFADILRRWRRNKVGMLAVQCQALSHGVDGFQDACNDVCWFGLTDMPEIHDQLNGRVYRQGNSGQVRIHYVLAKGTVDTVIWRTLRDKAASQDELLEGLREYRESKATCV